MFLGAEQYNWIAMQFEIIFSILSQGVYAGL